MATIEEVEAIKAEFDFDAAIVRYIAPRAARITGLPPEILGDRLEAIRIELNKNFNPFFCKIVCGSDFSSEVDLTGKDSEDHKAFYSKKGHDGVRKLFKDVARQADDAASKASLDKVVMQSDALLFLFLKPLSSC